MSDFVLTCESAADRTREFFALRNIPVVCFHYEIDGVVHADDLYQSISPDEFFAQIAAGAMPKTSQVSVGEYEEFWEPFVADLSSYLRGGRISAASAIIGTALKICPLMTVDCEGGLSPREKIRTKKRAISEMAKTMMAHVQDGADYSGKCVLSHSACREDAEAVAALIEEQVPQLKGKIEINNIGALIGSHTGPGTVALFFMGDKRVD